LPRGGEQLHSCLHGAFLDACKRRDLERALEHFDRRTQYRDLFRAGLHRQSFTPWTKRRWN
jgi:hypothetical protein